ncbi:GNAT family N-acetyltransferase [Jatrophihabitans telluris]|uniref:GNAT family N-acetyltransferase n=1 Tax=Jatrophihabitans telluris TaxID=2038343 RepID=A0ABY4QW85_9ACTN|nr:GNAT family N-acetyltransferase [Jatrophihabitans telluris]UQX87713.1 GNAT family N-acetyltransferase [Jatrophihabitans telluris]
MIDAGARGRRVVVRFRRDAADGRPPLTDAVGRLLAVDDRSLILDTARGRLEIPTADVQSAKIVGPDRREMLLLQELAHRGWLAAEVAEDDGWVLRANDGWTRRGNSVLPRAIPSGDLDELLGRTTRFYTERGLPARIQVPLPVRSVLDAELAARGWTVETEALVLTRPLIGIEANPVAAAGHAVPTDVEIVIEPRISADWLAGYGPLPGSGRQLLDRHDRVGFVSLRRQGRLVGRARGTVDEGWLAITSVAVPPQMRGSGLGRLLMSAVQDWGRDAGATDAHLQVEASNPGAVRFYLSGGWTEHHRYHYRLSRYPGPSPARLRNAADPGAVRPAAATR